MLHMASVKVHTGIIVVHAFVVTMNAQSNMILLTVRLVLPSSHEDDYDSYKEVRMSL